MKLKQKWNLTVSLYHCLTNATSVLLESYLFSTTKLWRNNSTAKDSSSHSPCTRGNSACQHTSIFEQDAKWHPHTSYSGKAPVYTCQWENNTIILTHHTRKLHSILYIGTPQCPPVTQAGAQPLRCTIGFSKQGSGSSYTHMYSLQITHSLNDQHIEKQKQAVCSEPCNSLGMRSEQRRQRHAFLGQGVKLSWGNNIHPRISFLPWRN